MESQGWLHTRNASKYFRLPSPILSMDCPAGSPSRYNRGSSLERSQGGVPMHKVSASVDETSKVAPVDRPTSIRKRSYRPPTQSPRCLFCAVFIFLFRRQRGHQSYRLGTVHKRQGSVLADTAAAAMAGITRLAASLNLLVLALSCTHHQAPLLPLRHRTVVVTARLK